MSAELKPCPFCGGKGRMKEAIKAEQPIFRIVCPNCEASSGYYPTKQEAIAAWNKRAEV